MRVTKRNGSPEELNIDNIHRMLYNCKREDLGRELDVSVSDTAINAHIKFADGMSTSDIQQTLIKSAAEHISTATPDYSIFAGRLLVTEMRKEVYGSFEPIPFLDYIKLNVESGLYDPAIVELYTEDEINYLGSQIDYDNDFSRPYSSIVQMDSKYLIKDSKTNRDWKIKNRGENVYIIPNSKVDHLGASAVDPVYSIEVELSRNWHWMWSSFYYNKKHNGFFIAVLKILSKFFSSLVKLIFYFVTFNKIKKLIHKQRLSGIINAIFGKKSWYRPKIPN